MSRENSRTENDSDVTEAPSTVSRRTILQRSGAGIASLGLLGHATDTASATTNCADGPFQRAYPAGSVTFSEIPSPEGPSPAPNENAVDTDIAPVDPENDDQLAAEHATIKAQGPPKRAQRAESSVVTTNRPDAGDDGLQIGTEYDGITSDGTRGGVPSDSQIATSHDKNLHAVNRQVAIFDKNTGEQELKVRLEDIWDPVIPTPEGGFVSDSPFVFDPRARYDRKEDRFVLCAVQLQQGIAEDGSTIGREEIEERVDAPEEYGTEDKSGSSAASDPDPRPPKGYFVVAVSATSDPTGKWYVYRLPPEDASGPNNLGLVDYPQLGLDRDAIYLSQNFFPNDDDGDVSVSIVTLDKASMYDGDAVTAHHFDALDNPADGYLDFTVQPALQPFSGGSDGTYYFLNSVYPRTEDTPLASTLTQWELTNPLDDPTLRCFIVEVDSYTSPPTAAQPDSEKPIDTLGRRLMNVDYNATTGSLWTAHATAISWNGSDIRSAITWYEIDAESRSLVQSGIYGEPGSSYFIPTINSDGDSTVIAHNVSGPDTFPRMDVSGRTANFSQNVLEDAVVVQDGKSHYNYDEKAESMRWGDYNGVSVDPETGRFWAVSQYSPDINIPPEAERRDPYHTRIAEVSFDQGDEQGSTVLKVTGQGSRAWYQFSVDGTITNSFGLTSEDSVSDTTASGLVNRGTDTYVYSGTLEDLTTYGDVVVTRNGEVITEDQA
ncbi:hypothetical protein [Natrinema salaciae]|uniref:Uncharacterized protein n=1 Tax=Natrinema salaciae TaxID=1186196 RepID=A0A1H9J9I8_9EURY|nr:hypothetical protein [Natrinema salaciae]SEQ83458.1 hypothetical protein SAMN04489841_2477 [Natrinema salaciae]